jgi:hypothetical protein
MHGKRKKIPKFTMMSVAFFRGKYFAIIFESVKVISDSRKVKLKKSFNNKDWRIALTPKLHQE